MERESRIQNAINEERLKTLKAQYHADESIRNLHHDMKNHLLAIRSMVNENANDHLTSYIDMILKQTEDVADTFQTGNQVLDGLLSQKAQYMRNADISFDVILDFRGIRFISDFDICTIFGNAVDNAIEACKKVAAPKQRYVSVHSECAAGQLLISVVNSYSGTIHMRNGLPITSKSNPMWHGIGLSNIRKTVRKYSGIVEIDLSTPEQFALTILIPMP